MGNIERVNLQPGDGKRRIGEHRLLTSQKSIKLANIALANIHRLITYIDKHRIGEHPLHRRKSIASSANIASAKIDYICKHRDFSPKLF